MHLFRQPQKRASQKLSVWSSPAVADSGWCSMNLLLGAGMVLIQPSTNKIVVICEPSRNYWFFPRGRKDIGETLETAALREAYEESGYRAEFMPVYNPSRAPAPPGQHKLYDEPNTEPVYMTTTSSLVNTPLHPVVRSSGTNLGNQYFTLWYIGQIPADATPEARTRMPDEENYVSHLLDYDEAMEKVFGFERDVLRYAWAVYTHTLEVKNGSVEAGEAFERQMENSQGVA